MKKIITAFAAVVFVLIQIVPALAQQTSEEEKVKAVLSKYNAALEALDVSGTDDFFVENSQILETGKIEGTYQDYIANHIGPELGHFKSFTFSDYKVDVVIDLPYAFTTESYIYTIVIKEDDRIIKSQGVSTTILKKVDGEWKIVKSHNSSRKLKN